MKNNNIKDIVIGLFAVIGFTSLIMGFTDTEQPQIENFGTPDSHVWEMTSGDGRSFLYNKKTGEVKLYVRRANVDNKTIGLREYSAVKVAYGEKK